MSHRENPYQTGQLAAYRIATERLLARSGKPVEDLTTMLQKLERLGDSLVSVYDADGWGYLPLAAGDFGKGLKDGLDEVRELIGKQG